MRTLLSTLFVTTLILSLAASTPAAFARGSGGGGHGGGHGGHGAHGTHGTHGGTVRGGSSGGKSALTATSDSWKQHCVAEDNEACRRK